MTVKERLVTYFEYKGLKISAVETKIGVSSGAIRKSANISSEVLSMIVGNYSDLNHTWLLTGEGSMLKDDPKPVACHTDTTGGIPLIPFSAMAGALRGEQTALEYECERYIIPAFRNADFLMHISGDSMVPTFRSGDIVACQRVPLAGLFFQWNKPYILDTDQGAIIKRINPGSDKQHVLICSDNKDYGAFELEYSQIHAVALVLGIIRLE